MSERRPITLITGASAGIGAALARTFARNGHTLMLVARREQRLLDLADEIAALGHPRPYCQPVDLERHDAVDHIAGAMERLGVEPDIVVNNAGFGLLGPAASLSRAEQLAMVDVNVRALTDVSLAFVDALERHKGGILNVASVAAFLPGPNMAVYYATKAYVLSFSDALHWELRPRGVRVTVVCPGPVPTEFQARAGFAGDSNTDMLTQSADQVAESSYRALRQGRRLVVPGALNRLTAAVTRLLPRRFLTEAVGRYNRKRIPK
ncbi:MAG: SDR family NAD(P)-dependent oxidoreductase [Rhizobiales bacterium]|nr:SDR family NAD(P)-dependent oxidoreductase [Hyphomicrobiales bacterium]